MMRSLIDTENELKNHEESLGELYQRVIRGEPVVRFPLSTRTTIPLMSDIASNSQPL